jgi:hypothetical protein
VSLKVRVCIPYLERDFMNIPLSVLSSSVWDSWMGHSIMTTSSLEKEFTTPADVFPFREEEDWCQRGNLFVYICCCPQPSLVKRIRRHWAWTRGFRKQMKWRNVIQWVLNGLPSIQFPPFRVWNQKYVPEPDDWVLCCRTLVYPSEYLGFWAFGNCMFPSSAERGRNCCDGSEEANSYYWHPMLC